MAFITLGESFDDTISMFYIASVKVVGDTDVQNRTSFVGHDVNPILVIIVHICLVVASD